MGLEGSDDLFHAAQSGNLERLRHILTDPACPVDAIDPKEHWAALHFAADSGHLEACRLLLSHGADADVRSGVRIKDGEFHRDWHWEPGHTPLMRAAQKGHLDVVELLIELGADVLLEDSMSGTSLHAACTSNQAKIIDLLLAKGARSDVSCSCRYFDEELGWHFALTPLHVAANCGSLEAAHLLLEHGVSIDKCWITRRTPLIYAAARGFADVVSLLCKYGADSNAREHRHEGGYFLDWSALHYAARNGHADAVAALLKCGAEPKARDSHSGHTALEMAERDGHDDVVAIIRNKSSR